MGGMAKGLSLAAAGRFPMGHTVHRALTGFTIRSKPSTSTRLSDLINATAPTNITLGVPLTSQECSGLGGSTALDFEKCFTKGQQTCTTVDQHGVVRYACIDKVAK